MIAVLEENWDSYHANSVPESVITIAKSFAHTIAAIATVDPEYTPQLVPGSDGSVTFIWHEKGYDLEVSILPDGTFEGYMQRFSDHSSLEW